jgi:hypothetical protein
MNWKELRGFYFPIFMEEINKVKTKYLNLIQQIQKTNQEKDRKLYIELRKSIENRIIEIDAFIEENFDKQYVLHFEKGKLKLKKLLQITPREKLTKQTLNKNFKDIDVLNKVLKRNSEKSKEIEKEKLNGPIYNKLPVEYELYENLIESMKYEELKNKNSNYKKTKYFGDNSDSESQSLELSNNDSHIIKNKRLSFGQNNNYNIINNHSEKEKINSKITNTIKNKNNNSNSNKNKK